MLTFSANERSIVEEIFVGADAEAAKAIEDGRLQQPAALATLMLVRDRVRVWDSTFADTLIARRTEAARPLASLGELGEGIRR